MGVRESWRKRAPCSGLGFFSRQDVSVEVQEWKREVRVSRKLLWWWDGLVVELRGVTPEILQAAEGSGVYVLR